MLESLNYSFRNPKNIIWVIYRIKHLRNYKKNGVLRGPQLGKQRWRPRLGILRVNVATCFDSKGPFSLQWYQLHERKCVQFQVYLELRSKIYKFVNLYCILYANPIQMLQQPMLFFTYYVMFRQYNLQIICFTQLTWQDNMPYIKFLSDETQSGWATDSLVRVKSVPSSVGTLIVAVPLE